MSNRKLTLAINKFIDSIDFDSIDFAGRDIPHLARNVRDYGGGIDKYASFKASSEYFKEAIRFAVMGKLLADRAQKLLKNSIKETWYIAREYQIPTAIQVYKIDGKVYDQSLKEIQEADSKTKVSAVVKMPIFSSQEAALLWSVRYCTFKVNNNPNSNDWKTRLTFAENNLRQCLIRKDPALEPNRWATILRGTVLPANENSSVLKQIIDPQQVINHTRF